MFLRLLSVLALPLCFAQTRSSLAERYGQPSSEIFLLEPDMRMTVVYGPHDQVCSMRIETPMHSDRVATSLSDARFWIGAERVDRLLAELVPAATRHGKVESDRVGLRMGEYALIESDEVVVIKRIQRNSPLPLTNRFPVADRLVTVQWKRAGCNNSTEEK